MKLDAPAKLNLRLRVLGPRADGYHAVESLLLRLRLADTVEVELAGDGVALEVAGPAAGAAPGVPADAVGSGRAVPRDASNLCCRAARALCEATGRPPGVAIRLTKRIPAAAGLGGGSSDAAAVLLALNELLDSPLAPADVAALAGSLGSDVPFFTARAAHALAWDRGQRLLPLPAPRCTNNRPYPSPIRCSIPRSYQAVPPYPDCCRSCRSHHSLSLCRYRCRYRRLYRCPHPTFHCCRPSAHSTTRQNTPCRSGNQC